VLGERSRQLEAEAAQLRRLARQVHERAVQDELAGLLSAPEEETDLVHAALLIARLDNEEVDVAGYRREIDRHVRQLQAALPAEAAEAARLAALNKYLFEEQGFHGSRSDYYNRANSYLNEVLDDREGLPITLCVLYLELARRLGLHMAGVGLPGHFVVEYRPAEGQPQLIDVFEGGRPLSRDEAAAKVQLLAGRPLADADLLPVTKRAIVLRMLHNLLGLASRNQDAEGILRYLNAILAVAPESGPERFFRAVVGYQTGRRQQSRADVEWLLQHQPAGVDLERVRELEGLLQQPDR
jgi:regulator of sirC expression with transglutaminase-like and TPR domain